jgi:hypothetical protein
MAPFPRPAPREPSAKSPSSTAKSRSAAEWYGALPAHDYAKAEVPAHPCRHLIRAWNPVQFAMQMRLQNAFPDMAEESWRQHGVLSAPRLMPSLRRSQDHSSKLLL